MIEIEFFLELQKAVNIIAILYLGECNLMNNGMKHDIIFWDAIYSS